MHAHEHIAEAERIIAASKTFEKASEHGFIGWSRLELAALAQVHATLAVAVEGLPEDPLTQFPWTR